MIFPIPLLSLWPTSCIIHAHYPLLVSVPGHSGLSPPDDSNWYAERVQLSCPLFQLFLKVFLEGLTHRGERTPAAKAGTPIPSEFWNPQGYARWASWGPQMELAHQKAALVEDGSQRCWEDCGGWVRDQLSVPHWLLAGVVCVHLWKRQSPPSPHCHGMPLPAGGQICSFLQAHLDV